MFATMYAAPGVGLAANQIGVDLQVFVIDCPDSENGSLVGHVVNPRLEPVRRGPRTRDRRRGMPVDSRPVQRRAAAEATPSSRASTPRATRCGSKGMAAPRAACSTRPTTSPATSTSTGLPAKQRRRVLREYEELREQAAAAALESGA